LEDKEKMKIIKTHKGKVFGGEEGEAYRVIVGFY
jgi:hypothetical protein